jgi:hypothetical protein
MHKLKNCTISLEIPKFCFNANSFLKYTWVLKNNGDYIPKIKYFFQTNNQIFSSTTLKFSKTKSFLLEINFNHFTNVIKSIKVCININKTLKSSGFFDFIYLPASNLNFNEHVCQNFTNKPLGDKLCSFYKNKVDLSVDLIPINFTRFKHFKNTFSFEKKNFYYKKNEKFYSSYFLNKNFESNPLGLDKRSFFLDKSRLRNKIDFKKDLAPEAPHYNFRENLRLIPSFALGFLLRLYKHRPIWTQKKLEKYLPVSLKKHLKKIIPIITYKFNGINPFKNSLVRFKYDPRKNSRSYIYQTIGFQKKLQIMTNKKILEKKKNPNFNFGQKFWGSVYPLCDINFAKNKRISLLKPSKQLTYRLGWLS